MSKIVNQETTDRVRIDGNWIEFDPHGRDHWHYDIELSRLSTETKLGRWLDHLDEKTWFDAPLRDKFISLVKQTWEQETI